MLWCGLVLASGLKAIVHVQEGNVARLLFDDPHHGCAPGFVWPGYIALDPESADHVNCFMHVSALHDGAAGSEFTDLHMLGS